MAILPVFDEFLPISSKLDHLCRFSRRPTLRTVVLTLCLPPARCGPRPSILSVETILPNFVAFLQISSKLDHLCRFSRNPIPTMPKSPLCLLPASWGPRALDFQRSGNIARFRWISSNLIKIRLFIQIETSSDPTMQKIYPLSPTCSLRTKGCQFPVQWQYCQFSMDFFQLNQNSTIVTDLNVIRHLRGQNQPFVSHLLSEDPGPSIPNVILPNFDGFLLISSKLNYLYRFSRHSTPAMPKSTLCLLPARWGPRALDSQYSGNIAWFWWISSNFVKTQLSIQM